QRSEVMRRTERRANTMFSTPTYLDDGRESSVSRVVRSTLQFIQHVDEQRRDGRFEFGWSVLPPLVQNYWNIIRWGSGITRWSGTRPPSRESRRRRTIAGVAGVGPARRRRRSTRTPEDTQWVSP